MKRVILSLLVLLSVCADLSAQSYGEGEALFPEQIVFRAGWTGVYTVHTTLTFLYPAIPETNFGATIFIYNTYLCHQRQDRSFFIGDYPMAVCARCTGINCGKLAGSASFLFREGRGEFSGDKLKESLLSCGLHGLMIVPMAVDGLTQKYTDYESNNAKRLATGLLYGYGLTVICDEIVWMLSSMIRAIR